MSQDYIYDVFISYRHHDPVLEWVRNHFHRLFHRWFPQFTSYEPNIFIDWDIETGDEWPAKLRQALKMSRCLVTIWSPAYFRSPWCTAEFHSFRERENILGLRTEENPSGLIYVVRYVNAKRLPPAINTIQYKDLSPWNTPEPILAETIGFVELDKQMQIVCQELVKMTERAPAWQNWPIITPEPSPRDSKEVPRFV